jgi:predicted MFS family arabinose efflux permease
MTPSLDGRRAPTVAVLILGGCGFAGYNLLLAAVPVLASRDGGRLGAGLATAVFMTVTCLVQASLPRILATASPHALLGAGLVLLGAPAALYVVEPSLVVLLLVTAVRGAGFGVVTVVSAALVAAYAAPQRRGAALGIYGLASSLTGVVAPPAAVLMVAGGLSTTTYWLGALLPLAPLGLLLVLRRAPLDRPARPAGTPRASQAPWRNAGLRTPALLFFPAAIAYGGLYTFLPLWSADAAIGLLAFGSGIAVGRFAGGRLADAVGPAALIPPLLVAVIVGIVGISVFPTGPGLAVAALVAGLGFGGTATACLVAVMSEVDSDEYALASAIWNLSFDLGIVVGGIGLGVVAQVAGYRAVFWVAAAGVACALVAATVRVRRNAHRGAHRAPTRA